MSEASSLSIPGKTFIIGEYAILGGLPAIVAAVPPRFTLSRAPERKAPFHPESPAGKLLEGTPFAAAFPYVFQDPLEGAGGFGASTAQFALCYRAFAEEQGWSLEWRDVWKKYRELSTGSGADLLTQWLGGVQKCRVPVSESVSGSVTVPFAEAEAVSVSDGFWQNFLIFSASHQAGRKTATHHHLDALQGPQFAQIVEKLRAPVERALGALERGALPLLGSALTQFADILRESGLEIEQTGEDRQALAKIPGVLGVKGTGANQSDAIIVLVESDSRCKERVIAQALSRGLKLVTSELRPQSGIESGTKSGTKSGIERGIH